MMAHAVEERLPSGELQVFVICRRTPGLRSAVRISDGKIILCLVTANTIHPKRRACRQSTNFLVGRKRFRNAAEQAKSDPTGWFLVAGDLPTGQQCFDLGRKPEGPPIIGIV